MKKPSLLIYIHGFNSSAQSHKARVIADYIEHNHPDIHVVIPQVPSLPGNAAAAMQKLAERYKDTHNVGLIGSSLGGYLSVWLNSLYGFKAVLVNPAIRPYELLQLGEHFNPYTHEQYVLEEKHIAELKALDVDDIAEPGDVWGLLQNGDEVLDYREAVEKLEGSPLTIENGGNHSFAGFERYLPEIIRFLELGTQPEPEADNEPEADDGEPSASIQTDEAETPEASENLEVSEKPEDPSAGGIN
ncbi:esterase YqiA [Vibrio sp. HA2012]|nr:esterase YqiA [Vibrio sp. HA2012]